MNIDLREESSSAYKNKFVLINRYNSPTSRLDPVAWVHSETKKTITPFDDGTFETNDGITGTWEITIVNEKRTFIIKNWAGTFVMPVDNWTPEFASAIVDPEHR